MDNKIENGRDHQEIRQTTQWFERLEAGGQEEHY